MQAETFGYLQTKTMVEQEELQPRKQVGILGGNFNPVHLAHLITADQVGKNLGLEKVYLMPSNQPPHADEKQTIAPEYRLAMLERAIQGNPLLAIEPIELEREGKSYTYDTILLLKERYPDTDYYFIIGGDMVEYLPKWYKIDELVSLVHFVGVNRPHYEAKTEYPIIWIDVPAMDISSTVIRNKIAQNGSVNYLVPENVLHYIYEKGLYGSE